MNASRDKGSGRAEAPDAELIRRFRDGDERAFVTLVRRHERRVYNLAFRMLGRAEDARDATQDAFLSCFRHLGSFREEAAFTTWLHRIAMNACFDMLRKRPPPGPAVEEVPAEAPTPDHAEAVILSTDVQRALLTILPEFRAVLILHELQDLPVEEVAEALNVPVGTVKSRLHRGRVALGRALAGESARQEPRTATAPSKAPNTIPLDEP